MRKEETRTEKENQNSEKEKAFSVIAFDIEKMLSRAFLSFLKNFFRIFQAKAQNGVARSG